MSGLREPLPGSELPPVLLLLFGASGDLAARELLPALYHLARAGRLPGRYAVVGTGRHSPGTDEEFRDQWRTALAESVPDAEEDVVQDLLSRVTFQTSDADDGAELAQVVARTTTDLGQDVRRVVYLSVPSAVMQPMIGMLGREGLLEGDTRLVVEKPFGSDLDSARELDATLDRALDAGRVYRIDHFLGYPGVLGLLAARHEDGALEALWDGRHVAQVQVDVPETLGMEGRGSFYEATGAFRDMVSTHLLQVLALVAMDRPPALDEDGLGAARSAALAAVQPLDPGQVVFGQYAGYREEEDVEADSPVETLVALRAAVDTPRWRGVPFLLRTGKSMPADRSTVSLVLRTGQVLQVELKDPPAGDAPAMTAYERLLHDVLHGRRELFSPAELVERLWQVCDPVLADPPPVQGYADHTWGPQAGLDLAEPIGWQLQR